MYNPNFLIQYDNLNWNILVVLEVEQRKIFLDQMTSLGKRKEYQQVISNEIADVNVIVILENKNSLSFF